eukprot:COSAG01_NODE_5719_length_4077_cov_50.179990_1_plen_500_part_00
MPRRRKQRGGGGSGGGGKGSEGGGEGGEGGENTAIAPSSTLLLLDTDGVPRRRKQRGTTRGTALPHRAGGGARRVREGANTTLPRQIACSSSSAAAAAAQARAVRTAAMAAPGAGAAGGKPAVLSFPLLNFLRCDFGPQMLDLLSVRRLWITRRVNRLFRELCGASLATVPHVALGGQDFSDGSCAQIYESLNLATMQWACLPMLPSRLVDATMVGLADGSGVVICGGMAQRMGRVWKQTRTTLLLRGDHKSGDSQWTELPPTNCFRSDARMVQLHDGRLLVLGGTHVGGGPDEEDVDVESVEALDVTSDQPSEWSFVAPMLQPRSAFATCVMSGTGEVLVAGGVIGNGIRDLGSRREPVETTESYSPLTNTWSLLPRVPAACRQADAGWEMADGRFCVRGRGGEVGSATRVCFALSHDRTSWEEIFTVSTRSGSPAAIPVRGGGCIMAGGMDDATGKSMKCAELWDEESCQSFTLPRPMQYARGFTFATANVVVQQTR